MVQRLTNHKTTRKARQNCGNSTMEISAWKQARSLHPIAELNHKTSVLETSCLDLRLHVAQSVWRRIELFRKFITNGPQSRTVRGLVISHGFARLAALRIAPETIQPNCHALLKTSR